MSPGHSDVTSQSPHTHTHTHLTHLTHSLPQPPLPLSSSPSCSVMHPHPCSKIPIRINHKLTPLLHPVSQIAARLPPAPPPLLALCCINSLNALSTSPGQSYCCCSDNYISPHPRSCARMNRQRPHCTSSRMHSAYPSHPIHPIQPTNRVNRIDRGTQIDLS